ncbi:MAG TPA: peptidoglycan-binding domain-containing protein [Gaiellaceae bacterium]|nr:peptidoglycan-binding domain-containing protein [Gaiellaceae bacterium]
MAGRDDDPGYDDWFDEPEPPLERRRRRDWGGESEQEDPWVLPEAPQERSRRPRARQREPLYVGGHQVTTTQVALIAGSAVAILLAILAAAGAFSSGSKSPAPATLSTLPIVTRHTSTQSTTTTQTQTTPAVQPPTATLNPGDSGDQVVLLQKALAALGYSPGKADGNYGTGTKQAVTAFQTAHGLPAIGVFGPATLAALQAALASTGGTTGTETTTTSTTAQAPSTALKPGDSGAQVVLLQQALAALGYSPGSTDGTYGPSTKAAVTAFQTTKGLTADGVLGPQTLVALQQALAGPTG